MRSFRYCNCRLTSIVYASSEDSNTQIQHLNICDFSVTHTIPLTKKWLQIHNLWLYQWLRNSHKYKTYDREISVYKYCTCDRKIINIVLVRWEIQKKGVGPNLFIFRQSCNSFNVMLFSCDFEIMFGKSCNLCN